MKRIDQKLPFMFRLENVAWFDEGTVKILDRRVYPTRIEYVKCINHLDVVKAIQKMVTQSGGPYQAASMGMVLAAKESLEVPGTDRKQFLEKAAYALSHARPTTSSRMISIVNRALEVANEYLLDEEKLVDKVFEYAITEVTERYDKIRKIANNFVELIPQSGSVMTQCFADVVLGMIGLRLLEKGNSRVKFYTPETRPYLQGSRLTSTVLSEMGFETTVITDNMAAITMKEKDIDVFVSAADEITMDGHVINKVGTLQIAIVCQYMDVPYYCLGTPNKAHYDTASVEIELRDPEEVLGFRGIKVTNNLVKGYYPAFDITPPKLCNGIITDKGIISPYDLKSYYSKDIDK